MTSNPEKTVRVRLRPEHRRKLIVEAAFKAIAASGFEGLRTRDIAASVGINSATLHHHFPTKEDLVAGVAEHLEHRFRSERALLSDGTPLPENDLFGGQFEDLIFYQQNAPDMLAVYREFVARSLRDDIIQALVERLHAGWKAAVVATLEQRRAQGELRANLDLDVAAGIIVSTAFGLVTRIFTSSAELNAAARQMRLLMAAGQA